MCYKFKKEISSERIFEPICPRATFIVQEIYVYKLFGKLIRHTLVYKPYLFAIRVFSHLHLQLT